MPRPDHFGELSVWACATALATEAGQPMEKVRSGGLRRKRARIAPQQLTEIQPTKRTPRCLALANHRPGPFVNGASTEGFPGRSAQLRVNGTVLSPALRSPRLLLTSKAQISLGFESLAETGQRETPPAAAPGGVSVRQPLAGRWRKIVALRPRHDLLAPSPFRFGAPLTLLPGVGSRAW
jgi:hypothetical protein